MSKRLIVIALLATLFQIGCNPASTAIPPIDMKHVVLQLRWDHQFQFGGYYAADWQGFYRAEGLDVEIRSAFTPDGRILSATEEVATGRADFGIGGADILIAADRGADLRVAATIFQYSGARFYLKSETPYATPADLLKLRVVRRVNDLIDVELQAMLLSEGIDPSQIKPYPHPGGIDYLLADEVQVVPGYNTTVPYLASQTGVTLKEIDPAGYGIDFYGDSIFTTGQLVEQNPEVVERFVRASQKGWEYALTHPQEIASEITSRYQRIDPVANVAAFNLFQTGVVKELTLYPVVELGHINPYRWEKMHQFLKQLGLVRQELNLDPFIFDPQALIVKREENLREILFSVIGLVILTLFIIFGWGYSLRKAVSRRTHELHRELASRQQTENALRTSEHQLRLITDNVPAYVAYVGMNDLRYRFVNAKFEESYKIPRQQIVGSHIKDIIGQANYEFAQKYLDLVRQGQAASYENQFNTAGIIRWVSVNYVPDVNEQGEVEAVVVLSFDITQQKQAVDELRFHSQILQNMSEGVLLTRAGEHTIIYTNPTLAQMFGYQPVELVGQPINILNAPDNPDPAATTIQITQHLKTNPTWSGGFHNIRKDGTTFWCYVTISQFDHPQYGVVWLSVHKDITERKQAEEALRASEENLRVTLNSIGDAVITTDTAGRITRINPMAVALTGWCQHEALGRPLTDVFSIIHNQTRGPLENPVEQVLRAGQPVELADHTVLVAKDGTAYLIADSGAPIRNEQGHTIGVVLVFRDVTDKLKAVEERLKLKKLESVGILAGGIAHDFNNLLTGLFGNIEMAKMFLPVEHKSYQFLEAAGRSMDSAVSLTKQLLTFAKGGDPIKETLSIGEVITETAQFLVRGSNIKLETDIDPKLWPVEADKGQLSQVISNLVVNAQQAMPTGGRVTIAGENVVHSKGRYVQITVQDEGAGIAAQYLDKVFDPYFTTKQKGSGLGLATAYSIISKHDGSITVESRLGQGATFTISLPAAEKVAEKPIEQLPAEIRPAAVSSARILVMDDEVIITEMIGTMLKQMGYSVEFAVDGQEALLKYDEAVKHGARFDAVILDLTIPGGMGGLPAAQGILQLDPQARIIVSSGYATDPVMANPKAYGINARIAKPYRFAELKRVMQEVLSE